ncbi:MAG: extracellular solute-binding protein [Lachnospiraceae bacterium]|nr:extracellular solute-binding protein [Lachnospiraceae bacterium]
MKKLMKQFQALFMSLIMVISLLMVAPVTVKAEEFYMPTIKYKVHRQTYGWEDEWKTNGESSGTMGESKRLEAIYIEVEDDNLGVEYRTHIQGIGWEEGWKADGELSGTEKQSRRLEAIQIRLTGTDAQYYDVYYRVHAQNYGWLGWVKNGESAGTAGQSKRLEAIQIVIVPAGWYPRDLGCEGSMGCGFVDIAKNPSHDEIGMVNYRTHVQTYGDQAWVSDGSIAGTSGESKRLEQIYIGVDNTKLGNLSGSIEYKTHVQSYGWLDWVKDGEASGTSGESKRLEAIKIRLTGDLARNYDVYYRVHAQNYGWLAWVKNGAPSGTEGYGKRLEAIQIVVVPKGTEAPNALPADDDASGYVSEDGSCSDVDTTIEKTDSGITVTDTKTPIYIYSWNEEFLTRIDSHFRNRYPEYSDLVITKNLDLSGTGPDYEEAIDELMAVGGAEVPSIFVADNDVIKQFMAKDYVIPVSDIGITEEMYANAYDYTVQMGTVDGELKSLAWQATPGVVAYRTDIAEEVLGYSDPDRIQSEALGDWDKFFETAEKMKAAGYYITSGPDEIKYAMMDSAESPWVVNGCLNIDPAVEQYLDYSKKLADGGYTKNAQQWSFEWTDNMADDVFCYFGCSWFIPWSLTVEETEAFGKYNVVVGPAPYHWGGSYVMVTEECTNKELAALVLYTMCCDEKAMYDLYAMDYDFCNNKAAVQQLIQDGKGCLEKLGGQNPLAAYDAAAKGVNREAAAVYDNWFYNFVIMASDDYNAGELATKTEAMDYIKECVSVKFPEVTIK